MTARHERKGLASGVSVGSHYEDRPLFIGILPTTRRSVHHRVSVALDMTRFCVHSGAGNRSLKTLRWLSDLTRWTIHSLLNADGNWWRYVRRVWVIQISGATLFVLLGTVLEVVVEDNRTSALTLDQLAPETFLTIWFILGALTPAIETILLWIGVWVIRFFTTDRIVVGLISGVAWGWLHAVSNTLANGIAATWTFFVLTLAMQVAAAHSQRLGLCVAFLPHCISNSLAVVVLFALSFLA